METLLIYLLTLLMAGGDRVLDPAVRMAAGRQVGRHLSCERISQREAHERAPSEVPAPHPRAGAISNVDAMVCTRPLLRLGSRPARDELVLSHLRDDVQGLALQAAGLADPGVRWVVDAHIPEPAVANKVAVAGRTALAELGASVSARAPVPAAGDVEVMRDLPLEDALALACRRMTSDGTLRPQDVWLSYALVRPYETRLHAGLCVRGAWRWLR